MNKSLISLALLCVLLTCVQTRSVYDHKKSYVQLISSINFQKQIQKNRETTKFVSILHFYKMNDGHSAKLATDLDGFASEYKGLFNIGAINCAEEPAICEKEKVTQFPTVRVYPPVPLPSIDVELPAADITSQAVFKLASRYLHDNSVEINSANFDTFIKESPAVPKVFLFTDKKGTPLIFKGLSVSLEGKQNFGIIRSTEEALVKKYQIKKFPTIILTITGDRKPKVYSGELKFTPIFDFLNVYSQTFVPDDSNGQNLNTKPWLNELVPEMHFKSGRDICLGQEGILCVILFNQGKPDSQMTEALKILHNQFGLKQERGLQYKFMWIDASVETKWANFFKFQDTPKIVIINPGKRKRVLEHEGGVTVTDLKSTIEKISNGDARFKRLADSDIPEFTTVRKDL